MKYITAVPKREIKGKTVLLRVDLDVHDDDIHSSIRVERTIASIRTLRAQGARVVILSHRGRPEPQTQIKNKKFSLKPFVKIIERACKEVVVFIPDITQGVVYIQKSNAQIFLCENLRFWKGEKEDSKSFARQLARMGDIYVHDAFANAHRVHASVHALARLLPTYAGPALAQEIASLTHSMKHTQHPCVVIIGGVKVVDKVGVLQWSVRHADTIMTGGGVANTFMKWCGYDIGSSVCDTITTVQSFVANTSIHIPHDVITEKGRILDIGPRTIQRYIEEIRRAQMIIWNGPLGLTDVTRFQKGSRAIWNAIIRRARADARVRVIVGGGETVAFVRKETKKIPKNIFVSAGGGAMLAYIGGKKLPGLEVL